ncbi:MAG: hypothetical protein ACP5IK_04095, partial [Candidatus Micrarchaeia archaeon]
SENMIGKIEIAIIVILIVLVITLFMASISSSNRHVATTIISNSTSSLNFSVNLTGKQVLIFPPENYSYVFTNGKVTNATYYPIYLFSYPIPVAQNSSTLVPTIGMNEELRWQIESFGVPFGDEYYVYGVPKFTSTGLANSIGELIYTSNQKDLTAMVYAKVSNWTIYTDGYNFKVENGSYAIYSFISIPSGYSVVVPNGTSSSFMVPQWAPGFPSKFLPVLDNLTAGIGVSNNGRTWWFYNSSYMLVNFVPQPIQPGFYLWIENTTS